MVKAAVLEHIASLRLRFPEMTRAIWFGSRVNGRPTRSSDVDLCIVLRSSSLSFIDRIPLFLPDRFPTSVDVFPYTEAEFAQLERTSPQWTREIARGREL